MKRTFFAIFEAIILLFAAGCAGSDKPQAAAPAFDYYIDCTTRDDIEALSNEPFVDRVFPFTLLIFQRPGYNIPMQGQIAFLAAPSFDNLEATPANSAAFVAQDKAIMQDPAQNPILIDETLAKAENLSIGDKFYQETKLTDAPLEFTVAGIYRHIELFAQFEAVVLTGGQIEQLFAGIVDELGYTNAYIKASDTAALKAHLDDGFIPHLPLKGLSEAEIAELPPEDLKAYYEDYSAHMNRMQ